MNIEHCLHRIILCLPCLLAVSWTNAESLLAEGAREIEEFRMQQLSTVRNNGEISPFTTDGCSGNLSSSWEQLAETFPKFKDEFGDKPPWESCCLIHDQVYWQGDTVDGFNQRLVADQELRQCVIDTGNELAPELGNQFSRPEAQVRQTFLLIADVMYRAVRLGGQPCSLLPWRWGYGWPNCAFTPIDKTPAGYSDLKGDERVVFFSTAGWLDPAKTHWNIPIHAWVYEPVAGDSRRALFASLLESNYELLLTDESKPNFKRRGNLLIADNERGKQLVVRIAGQDIVLPETAENGHAKTVLRLPVSTVAANSDQELLRFVLLLAPRDERRFEGQVQLVSDQGISVISDIDDTIKITEVTDRKRLLDNTFYQDFRAVPGMPELYRYLAASGVSTHFVSSSPWQLYEPLQEFLDGAGFPQSTLNLKAFRFRDETLRNLFKKGTETKPAQIEPVLQQYPQRKFILIGDSGEQDPEVYGDIARRYPGQIQKILIRNLDGADADSARYRAAFAQLPRGSWQLFENTDEITATEINN